VMPRLRNMGKEGFRFPLWCGHPAATLALECNAIQVSSRTRTHPTRPFPIIHIIVGVATKIDGILVGLWSRRELHLRILQPGC
jgi:hypothetical protein